MLKNCIVNREGDPQIFIVGMARSGTTLLSEILNTHSKIVVSPETHYFRKYWLSDKQASLKKRVMLSKKFLASDEFKQFGFSVEEKKEIEGEILEGLKSGQTEILTNVLTRYRLSKKKTLWVEKTTAHLMFLPQITKLFPASQFVCLVRDPRDICLSLKKVPFNAHSTMSIARRWKRYSKRSSLYRNEYKTIFLEIKYEDLINNPEHELKKVCKFFSIDYQSKMLNRNNDPSTFDGKKEFWKLNAIKPIDKNNFDKWKREMRPGEIYFLQKYLSREMYRYKYDIKPIRFDVNVFWQLLTITGHWFFTISVNLALRAFGIRRYNW
jgi:hypothetical protein